jgi:hypothetical protein
VLCIHRDWRKADWEALQTHYLLHTDWYSCDVDSSNVNHIWQSFYDKLLVGAVMFVPAKVNRTSKTRKVKFVPRVVRKLQASKLKQWRSYKRDKTLVKFVKYKKSAACVKLAYLKSTVENEEVILLSNNLGRFYKHVNSHLSHKEGVGPLKRTDGSMVTTNEDKATVLNSAFTTSRTVDNGLLPALTMLSVSNTISHIHPDENMIEEKLSNLKQHSASGPDCIPTILLKMMALALKAAASGYVRSFLTVGRYSR